MDALDDRYEADVIAAVIHAVLDARGDGTGQGGIVDPKRTFDAMCFAIGVMANNIDTFTKPSDQREFAERCRKAILRAMRAAADPNSGLAWMQAKPLWTN